MPKFHVAGFVLSLAALAALASCSSVPSSASLAPATATGPPTAAQMTSTGDRYGPIQGESELTFAGSLGVTDSKVDVPGATSQSDVSLNGQVGYGRYLTNEHEVGGQILFNLISPDNGDDFRTIGLLPYYRYNFRNSERTWFYGGVHAGLVQFEQAGNDDTAFSCGIHGGMKSWLTPNVSFFVEPRLTFTEFGFGSVDLETTEFRTLVGISYSF